MLSKLIITLKRQRGRSKRILTRIGISQTSRITRIFSGSSISIFRARNLIRDVSNLRSRITLRITRTTHISLSNKRTNFLRNSNIGVQNSVTLSSDTTRTHLIARTLINTRSHNNLTQTETQRSISRVNTYLVGSLARLVYRTLVTQRSQQHSVGHFLDRARHSLLLPLCAPSPNN